MFRIKNKGRFHFWLLFATYSKLYCVRSISKVKYFCVINLYLKPHNLFFYSTNKDIYNLYKVRYVEILLILTLDHIVFVYVYFYQKIIHIFHVDKNERRY